MVGRKTFALSVINYFEENFRYFGDLDNIYRKFLDTFDLILEMY